jgi:hypothetical protein
MNPLNTLSNAGVSIWLDDLSRERLVSGSLADLVARDRVVGVTTNPTIFAKAITSGVTRFIGLATPSLADPQDKPHWKHKVLPVMAGLMFPNAPAELKGMTEAVTDSGLDYTIARITNPTNKPATGRIRSGFLGHDKVASAMSCADIAAFLVSQLTDTRYRRAMPAISN